MKAARFDQVQSVKWGSAIPALPANAGYKLRGTITLDDGATVAVYLHLKGNAHLSQESRLNCKQVCPNNADKCEPVEKSVQHNVLTKIKR